MNKTKLLIIDDDQASREILRIFLNDLGYNVILAKNGEEGFYLFTTQKPDLIITDIMMPGLNGIELLKKIKSVSPNIPVILISAYGQTEIIISGMQLGAYDYVEKPFDKRYLNLIVEKALNTSSLSTQLEDVVSNSPDNSNNLNMICGKSPEINEIFKKIGKISQSRVNVLIHGETGTGKELVSRTIHQCGVTKDSPFVAVNFAALPEALLESELFGHVQGAFTDAIRDKKGKFELAGDGTIFLDEIGDASLSLQVKLLRVIQEREFERVGGENTIPMKARVIAATNKNLEELVKEGRFREDLYYRLKVFCINIPPLRERKSDIPLLVIHLLKKINFELHKNVNKISYNVIEMLQDYDWVGNVRELENVLMQGVLLAKGEVLEEQNILLSKSKEVMNKENIEDFSLAVMEKAHIIFVLDKINWNKSKAAKLLKISKQTLYNKIKAYNITPPSNI